MFLGEDGSKRIPDEGAVEKLAPAPPDPAFGYRVIQRRTWPAHRLGDPEPLAGLPEHARGVLTALIGVKPNSA
jgi:hypothetical protein